MNPSLPVRKYKFTSIKYHYDSRTKPELVNTNGKEIHMWYRRPMLWDRWPCNLNPLTFQGFLTLRIAPRHFIFLKTNPMELYNLHYKAHWLTSEKMKNTRGGGRWTLHYASMQECHSLFPAFFISIFSSSYPWFEEQLHDKIW